MTDESKKEASKEVGGTQRNEGGSGADPEKGRRCLSLQEMAKEKVEQFFEDILNCILLNARAGKLPPAKLLLNLAWMYEAGHAVSMEEMVSVSSLLLKSLEEQKTVEGEKPTVFDVLEIGNS